MRPSTDVEEYVSLDVALRELRERSESERLRFITRYGVDKARLRNYNLVCDTTNLTPDMVTENVIETFEASSQGRLSLNEAPLLMLDPRRVYPTQDVSSPTPGRDASEDAGSRPISVGYADSVFYVIDGHRRLGQAIRDGLPFITAELQAEADEFVVGGVSAAKYAQAEVTPARIREWEQAHGFPMPVPQHLAPPQPAATAG
jgi:cytidylate kinase